MDEERRAYLDRVLVGGREPRAIVIVDSRPEWETRFAHERDRIVGALGSVACRVEHIGSTAVPGLAAKPIVDIAVAVDAVDGEQLIPPLEAAGYLLRVREEDHLMFRPPTRDVHVHVWPDGPEIERHLAFRDRLRASPGDRLRYERVKRELATRTWETMDDYADAKSDVIAEIVRGTDAPPAPKLD